MAVTAHAVSNHYRRDWEDFLVGRRESEVLIERRRQALERFETLGIPDRHQEAWRFTDVSDLAQTPYHWVRDEALLDSAQLPPELDGRRLVFVNGRLHAGLSRLEAMPQGVSVTSLAQAWDQAIPHLDRLPGLEQHPFSALNSAFFQDGAYIHVSRAVALDTPLQLVFYSTGMDSAVYPRNLIVLDEAAQACIVEEHCGDGAYLSCPLTEIRVGAGAVLNYHKLQDEDRRARHLGGLRLQQERDSQVTYHSLSMGALLSRTDSFVLLNGEGADCTLNGLTLVEDQQLGDHHVQMEHARPHGSSRQLFKGILDAKARTVFDGLIHVHQDAQKTDAGQHNRNLLLSRQAQANSNPRLEIYADDVKCNHGSAVGFLDPDALFYLRSRGLAKADARAMLVYAFANDSIERIGLTSLRERLEKYLLERLYPGGK